MKKRRLVAVFLVIRISESVIAATKTYKESDPPHFQSLSLLEASKKTDLESLQAGCCSNLGQNFDRKRPKQP